MSLTNTTGADEQFLLEKSVEKIKDSLGINTVYDRIRSVSSIQDATRKLTVKPDARREVRYCDLEFLRFEDSQEGDDDCPVAVLVYRLHIAFQFVEVRPDGSNSAREFTAAILRLRKDFLESTDVFDADRIVGRYEPLVFENNAGLGTDTQTGIEAHTQDYFLRVKHYGN